MAGGPARTPTAPGPRDVVVDAVARQAASFPDIHPPVLQLDPLPPRDRALAVAIYRTVAQRWLTVEHVLRAYLDRSMHKVEPQLRAILLTAGAQLLFMDRMPPYAVVDEAVGQAHRRLRKGAGKLANAVLRRVAQTELADHLPDPMDTDRFLSIWTSHPVALVGAWRGRYGEEQTRSLLRHSNVNPPTLVHAPAGDAPAPTTTPHERSPFVVWDGSHEQLAACITESADRWVQDPSAYAAVAMAAPHVPSPRTVLDYCAGVGTKTRQLAHAFPGARVVATDDDPHKLKALQRACRDDDRVSVMPIDEVGEVRADLALADVPCSNTGVLARRPEARYRYRDKALAKLVALQRRIVERVMPLLGPDGVLVYSTCSLEPRENAEQVTWAAETFDLELIEERVELPSGQGRTYHDGAYAAMLRRRPAG